MATRGRVGSRRTEPQLSFPCPIRYGRKVDVEEIRRQLLARSVTSLGSHSDSTQLRSPTEPWIELTDLPRVPRQASSIPLAEASRVVEVPLPKEIPSTPDPRDENSKLKRGMRQVKNRLSKFRDETWSPEVDQNFASYPKGLNWRIKNRDPLADKLRRVQKRFKKKLGLTWPKSKTQKRAPKAKHQKRPQSPQPGVLLATRHEYPNVKPISYKIQIDELEGMLRPTPGDNKESKQHYEREDVKYPDLSRRGNTHPISPRRGPTVAPATYRQTKDVLENFRDPENGDYHIYWAATKEEREEATRRSQMENVWRKVSYHYLNSQGRRHVCDPLIGRAPPISKGALKKYLESDQGEELLKNYSVHRWTLACRSEESGEDEDQNLTSTKSSQSPDPESQSRLSLPPATGPLPEIAPREVDLARPYKMAAMQTYRETSDGRRRLTINTNLMSSSFGSIDSLGNHSSCTSYPESPMAESDYLLWRPITSSSRPESGESLRMKDLNKKRFPVKASNAETQNRQMSYTNNAISDERSRQNSLMSEDRSRKIGGICEELSRFPSMMTGERPRGVSAPWTRYPVKVAGSSGSSTSRISQIRPRAKTSIAQPLQNRKELRKLYLPEREAISNNSRTFEAPHIGLWIFVRGELPCNEFRDMANCEWACGGGAHEDYDSRRE
ncbi:hypothetical protein G7Y89_g12369 [Cudoniella acicularis]|uniref:Uncharacterized protein n=1 Tax=Cudoniella acicularis TaxID=354080 RepID=A0A8H4RBJ0_9HELO|nr:hypothetical protein G7Y89_g12369 [Cudoniella acicularis]